MDDRHGDRNHPARGLIAAVTLVKSLEYAPGR